VEREVVFDWEAAMEAEEARQWYADKNAAVAERFVESLRGAVARLREAPERWAEFEPGVRRVMLGKFPYAIVYAVKPDRVLVLAVMHFRRHPACWHGRPRTPPPR
jgi:plasmid stabilization system protein ParE